MILEQTQRGLAREITLSTTLSVSIRGPRVWRITYGGGQASIRLPETTYTEFDAAAARTQPGATKSLGRYMGGAGIFTFHVTGGPVQVLNQDSGNVGTITGGQVGYVDLIDASQNLWGLRTLPTTGSPAAQTRREYGAILGGNVRPTDFDRYDAIADAWTSLPTSPVSRYRGAGASRLGDGILFFGDETPTPASGSSSYWDGVAFQAVSNIPVGMLRSSGVTLHDWGYAISGEGSGRVFRHQLKNNLWEEVAPMPLARFDTQALAMNDRIIVFAGQPSDSVGVEYIPEQNQWWEIPSHGFFNRSRFAAFAQNGNAYLCGGIDANGDATDEVLVYDPLLRSWSQGQPLTQGPRYEMTSFSVAGFGCVVGGKDSTNANTGECRRMANGSWQPMANFVRAESGSIGGAFVA